MKFKVLKYIEKIKLEVCTSFLIIFFLGGGGSIISLSFYDFPLLSS